MIVVPKNPPPNPPAVSPMRKRRTHIAKKKKMLGRRWPPRPRAMRRTSPASPKALPDGSSMAAPRWTQTRRSPWSEEEESKRAKKKREEAKISYPPARSVSYSAGRTLRLDPTGGGG